MTTEVTTRVIAQVTHGTHTLRILFKDTYERNTTLLTILNTINGKLNIRALSQSNEDENKTIVSILKPSPSHHSQKSNYNELSSCSLEQILSDESNEVCMLFDFKEFGRKMVVATFIHTISLRNSEDTTTTTSPKEVLLLAIADLNILMLESTIMNSGFVDDMKRLITASGVEFITLLPSLLFPLLRIAEFGADVKCGEGQITRCNEWSKRAAGELIVYLMTEHSWIAGPYLMFIETMVMRLLTNHYRRGVFSKIYPEVLKQLNDLHGTKGTKSIWTAFLDFLTTDAVYWETERINSNIDLIDTLKNTISCIGKEGITASEQEEIARIISIALNASKERPQMEENEVLLNNEKRNERMLRQLASLIKESVKTFGKSFLVAILPDVALFISLIYSCKWGPEFTVYLRETALEMVSECQTPKEIEAAFSCFQFVATKTIKYIRRHLITLLTVCEKNLTHPINGIRTSAILMLERIMCKQWMKIVLKKLGVKRINDLCHKLLMAAETEVECSESLNRLISAVADWRMEGNLKWYELVLFIEEASTTDNNKMKKTATMVLRRAPSLVIGEGEAIANSIKNILLARIQEEEHREDAIKTFAVLAEECDAKDDEWILRGLSDIIPIVLTMAYCALENGKYDSSDIEAAFDFFVQMLRLSIMDPYLPSILSLCKTTLDTARLGQRGQISKELEYLAVSAARHVYAKMGSMKAKPTRSTEPLCALGSHSIEVVDLEVEGYEAKATRNRSTRTFKRLQPPILSFACVYSLFASIDKMRPTEGACMLLFLHSHGCMDDGNIMIEPVQGLHKCEGYNGKQCDPKENGGKAWPIYLVDVIHHMSQRLKQLDKEENRRVKSVAILSPVICLVNKKIARKGKQYNANKRATDNASLILNSQDGQLLATKRAGKDPIRLVPLEVLASHKSIREGLEALTNVINGKHGKFRVYMDRGWIHSRVGEEFVAPHDGINEYAIEFHNVIMGKDSSEENSNLATPLDSDCTSSEDVTQDSSEENSNLATQLDSDCTSSEDVTQDSHSSRPSISSPSDKTSDLESEETDDPSIIIPFLEKKLHSNESRDRLDGLQKLDAVMLFSDEEYLPIYAIMMPTLIGLVYSALKKEESCPEIRLAFTIIDDLIDNSTDSQHLSDVLKLCHTVLESVWIEQCQEGSSIRSKVARMAKDVRTITNSMTVFDLSVHHADKSAFVPALLSFNDDFHEDVVMDGVISSKAPITLHCLHADKSAFILLSSHDGISDDASSDDFIFGKDCSCVIS